MSDHLDLSRWKARRGLSIACVPETGSGWNRVLSDALDRIAKAIEFSRGSISIVQIKEKLGELRIYYDERGLTRRERSAVEVGVSLAEARSRVTCETCGSKGTIRSSNSGWIHASCDAHSNGSPAGRNPDAAITWNRGRPASRRKWVEERVRYDEDLDRIVVLSRRTKSRRKLRKSVTPFGLADAKLIRRRRKMESVQQETSS